MGGRSSNSGIGSRKTTSEESTRLNARLRVGLTDRLERIREESENRRIVEEARQQRALGTRVPSLEQGQRISDISPAQAELELFNAPVGTVIRMDNHNTGDYVGEYTRTEDGWRGSQQYVSGHRTPANVSTARGFAMQVVGNDIRVIQTGRTRRR